MNILKGVSLVETGHVTHIQIHANIPGMFCHKQNT